MKKEKNSDNNSKNAASELSEDMLFEAISRKYGLPKEQAKEALE